MLKSTPPPSTKKLHLIEEKDFVFQIFIYAIIQTKLIESIKLILGNLNVERFFFFFFSPFLLVKTVKGFNFLPFKKNLSPPAPRSGQGVIQMETS